MDENQIKLGGVLTPSFALELHEYFAESENYNRLYKKLYCYVKKANIVSFHEIAPSVR